MPSIIPVRRNVLHRVVVTSQTTSATTWDPAHANAAFTFSGGNLVVSCGNTGDWTNVRTTTSHASGKYYAEADMTSLLGNVAWGICNASFAVATLGAWLGNTTNGIAYGQNGTVFQNGGQLSNTLSTFTGGDVIALAFDCGSGKIWYRVNGGSWDNAGGADDPASGSGGFSTGLGGQSVFVCLGLNPGGSNTITGNFGPSFGFTPPSGFSAW